MTNSHDQKVRILDDALQYIARFGDCQYLDHPEPEGPCPCPVCAAKRALAESRDWRFRGAMFERTHNGFNPREAKIHKAWIDLLDDRKLSQILREEDGDSWPSARDWYVATSVVQWLATNVGMSILQAAGFEYTQWDQDRAELDARRHPPVFKECAACAAKAGAPTLCASCINNRAVIALLSDNQAR